MAHFSPRLKASLWILPLGLVLGMGLYHRQYKEVVDIPEYGPKHHAQLTAYVVLVRKAEKLSYESSRSDLKKTADEWIAARRAHKLQDVARINPYDSSRSVAKEAILDAKALILGLLKRQIQSAWERGDVKDACTWTNTALELNGIMSETDMASYLAALHYEAELLQRTLPYWSEINLSERREWLEKTDPKVQEETVANIVALDSQIFARSTDNHFRKLRAKERAREVKELVISNADPRAVSDLVKQSPGEMVSTMALAKQALTAIRNRERLWAPYRQSFQASLVAKSN